MVTRIFYLCILFLLSVLGTISHADAAADPQNKVSVQLSWKYQFQFAPFIAASEKGFYREAGLDVEIQEGGPGIDPIDQVINGKADFGVFSSALVVEFARGKPVVALAAMMQHSPVTIISRNTNNISSVHDLAGKTIAVSMDTRDEIRAYLQAVGISDERINIINKTGIALHDLEIADAISAYISNEGFFLQGKENDYLLFSPRSAGIDLFGNILFTSAEQIKTGRKVVNAFRAATLRGLNYALTHQDEMTDLILAKYNTQNKTREHLLYEAEKIAELTRPDIVEPGYMSPGRWHHVADVYASLGKMPSGVDLTKFIYDPEPRPNTTWLYWLLAAIILILFIVSGFLWQSRRFNLRLQDEIRERQQAETLFRASEARFKDLFDKNPDPCWLLDGNSVIECNQAAVSMLGYPSKEALKAVHPADVSPKLQPDGRRSKEKADEMMSVAQEQGVNRFEWMHQRLNGECFPAEVTIAKYNLQGRNILYAVWRDITERKRAEKMKDEFISTVSHEIRTPLTSTLGALGLLAGGVCGELSDKAKSLIEIASTNAQRLLLLINDILDLSKIEAGQLEYRMAPIELMPFIEEAISANQHYGRKHRVEFVLQNRLDGAWVYGDSNRLMQVMNNLLSNAAKFSKENPNVDIQLERDKDQVVIKIRDYGVGIPEEFQARIFDKFSQADSSDSRQIGGTGLGLNISRAIVLAHYGSISFDSIPGEGTEFRVALPEYYPD